MIAYSSSEQRLLSGSSPEEKVLLQQINLVFICQGSGA
jgi:hypothetical protein